MPRPGNTLRLAAASAPVYSTSSPPSASCQLPVRIQVNHQRQDAIGLAAKGITMLAIEITRAIMGEMTFEGEQSQQQLAIEKALQPGRPLQPGLAGR